MKKLLILLLPVFGFSQVFNNPNSAMNMNFVNAQIEKTNIILNTSQQNQIQNELKSPLDTKIYRIYVAKNNNKQVGYGVLLNKKVRTKSSVALYIIDANFQIKSIEIMAFYEPLEYLPNEKWLDQFDELTINDKIQLNQTIPAISGATLSANSIVKGVNEALLVLKYTQK